jgi:hypothetical protein
MEKKALLFMDQTGVSPSQVIEVTKTILDDTATPLDLVIIENNNVFSSMPISNLKLNNNLGKKYPNLTHQYSLEPMAVESFLLEKASKNTTITYIYGQEPIFHDVVKKYEKSFLSHKFSPGDNILQYVYSQESSCNSTMDSSMSLDRENKIIKEAVDKLTKQFRAHPEKIEQTKGVLNLFSILKNLVNGSMISAKMDIRLVNDFTVDALAFMVKNKILSIPSLELGLKHG